MTLVEDRPAVVAEPVRRRRFRTLPVLAVAWLAFVVLQRLLSGQVWVWLMPDLIPPLLFVLVPIVLGLLGFRRRLVIIVSVAALLLGIGHSGLNPHAIVGGGDGPAPGSALHVVSWNAERWSQGEDPGRFFGFLRARNADIYLFQEYLHWDDAYGDHGARQIDEVERLKAAFPGFHVVTRGELATVSRFPIVATPRVSPDTTDEPPFPELYQQAKVLRTDLQVGSRVLSVYNTHISVQLSVIRSPVTTGFYEYIRHRFAMRARQFEGLRADVAANHEPAVIAGDFNTSPAMDDMDPIRSVATDALRANRSLYPRTWHTEGLKNWWRLDWAFTTAGVRVHRYDFVDPGDLSDHRAQDLVISLEDR